MSLGQPNHNNLVFTLGRPELMKENYKWSLINDIKVANKEIFKDCMGSIIELIVQIGEG